MKKVLFSAILILSLMAILSTSCFAATRQDVINAATAVIPDAYKYLYVIQLENILMSVELTSDECDELLEIIADADVIIDDRGNTLDLYPPDEVKAILELFDEACEVLEFTYEVMSFEELSYHEGDVAYILYDKNGELVGIFDGDQDPIRETGAVKTDSFNPDAYFAVITFIGAAMLAVGISLTTKNRRLISQV